MRTTKVPALVGVVALVCGTAALADEAKPNDGKAEAVTKSVGTVVGSVAGGVAGEYVGGPRGALAGGAAGGEIGGAVGAAAGRALDQHAVENQQSGRGGPADPRYDPSTLLDR